MNFTKYTNLSRLISLMALFFLMFYWCLCCFIALAQDVSSEERENDITLGNSIFTNFLINPAFAGAENKLNFNFSGTWYWLGTGNKFPTESFFAIDGNLLKTRRIGLGGYFVVFGGLPNFKTDLSVSSQFDITGNTVLRIGFSISPYTQMFVQNTMSETFGDMIHSRYGFIYSSAEDHSYESLVKIIGSVRSGLWLSNPRFLAGVSLDNIHPYISRTYINQEKYFDISALTTRQLAGYHFIFNRFKITPVYGLIYGRIIGFYHGIGITFAYRDKCFMSTSSDFRLGIIGVSAGCLFLEKFSVMCSSAFYTNPYLHQITGTALLNFTIRYSE